MTIEAAEDLRGLSPVVVLLEGEDSAATLLLSDSLQRALLRETSFEILNAVDSERVKSVLHSGGNPKEIADKLGARSVLFGWVNRYVDSTGSQLGGEQLSAVSFRLFLFDAGRQSVVWSATFASSDQPLSEDLFRLPEIFSRGLRYRRASDLAQYGFSEAAKDLEARTREVR